MEEVRSKMEEAKEVLDKEFFVDCMKCVVRNRLNLRESVGNVKFTPEEMELLKQGGMVKDKHFENDKGQKFTVDFQVSADRKNVAFVPGSSRQEVISTVISWVKLISSDGTHEPIPCRYSKIRQ